MEDLWPPDLKLSTTEQSPVGILRLQGEFLTKRTNGSIRGLVERGNDDADFVYSFYLYCPGISYRNKLFTISHSIMLYPLSVRLDTPIVECLEKNKATEMIAEHDIEIRNETLFLDLLTAVFATDRVGRIIAAMIANLEGTD